MVFVGRARGAYIRSETYEYVGEGQGNYDTVTLPGQRRRHCQLCFLGLLVACMMVALCWVLWETQCTSTTTIAVVSDFDCNDGEPDTWVEEKQSFCCERERRGCPLNCDAGLNDFGDGWSVAKKIWCCSNEDKGCLDGIGPFDCDAGISNFERGWSDDKQVWCCLNAERGCPMPPSTTTTSAPFDCDLGFSNWEAGWSRPKIVWCCDNFGRACPPTTSPPYDCKAGLSNAGAGWSTDKKAWCCQNKGEGCSV